MWEGSRLQVRKRVLTRNWPLWHPYLGFPASRLWEMHCCCWSHPICCILLCLRAKTDSYPKCGADLSPHNWLNCHAVRPRVFCLLPTAADQAVQGMWYPLGTIQLPGECPSILAGPEFWHHTSLTSLARREGTLLVLTRWWYRVKRRVHSSENTLEGPSDLPSRMVLGSSIQSSKLPFPDLYKWACNCFWCCCED